MNPEVVREEKQNGLIILRAGSLGLLCLQWIAVWVPQRLWGIHHLAFVRAPEALALSALFGFALALSLKAESREWIQRRLESWPAGPWLTTALVTVIMGVTFLRLPVAHRLLGDGGLIADQVAAGVAGERLDSTSLRIFSWLLDLSNSDDPDGVARFFRIMTLICGCIYVTSSLAAARLCGEDAAGRVLAFAMMIGVAPLLLFFGYPEHYAPATAGLAVVTVCILAWGGHRLPWLLAGGATGLLTTLAHQLAGFCLVPLGVAVVLHVRRVWHWRARNTAALGLGIGVTGLVFAGVLMRAKAGLLIPFTQDAPYAMWEAGHIADTLNGLLLMAPLHPVVVIAALSFSHRRLVGDPVLLCLGVFTLAAAVATSLVDPALGALDWDLMSMFSIPLAGLTALCAGRYLPPAVRVPGLVVVAAAIFLHLAPWILVNHRPAQAARMVEAMGQHDPHHDAERRMKLAVKLEHGGFDDAARRQYAAALQADDTNLAALRNLGFLLYTQGDVDKALQLLHRLRELSPTAVDSRTARSLLLWHAGEEGAAVRLAVAHLVDRSTDRRAADLCRTFAGAAALPEDRVLASIGVALAADDITSVKRNLALPEADRIDSELLDGIRRWLAKAQPKRENLRQNRRGN